MWEQLKRITKDNGAICLFGKQPFTSNLIMSNPKMYKYDWYWKKNRPANINCGNIRPMDYIEIISVFHEKKTTYNKQMVSREGGGLARQAYAVKTKECREIQLGEHNSGAKKIYQQRNTDYDLKVKNPMNIIEFPRVNKTIHPTQKPVPLLEYLIKTYTLENETVLDFTMGSGSTGVACKNLNRKFIGIEKDDKYFKIARDRVCGANTL